MPLLADDRMPPFSLPLALKVLAPVVPCRPLPSLPECSL